MDILLCYANFNTILKQSQKIIIKRKKTTKKLSFLERVVGIEPTFPAWKAGVLPIYDTRIFF